MHRWVWVLSVVVATLLFSAFASASREAPALTRPPTASVTSRTRIDSSTRELAPLQTKLEGDLLAYAPLRSVAGTHPKTIVYMHGAHGRAEQGCPTFRS